MPAAFVPVPMKMSALMTEAREVVRVEHPLLEHVEEDVRRAERRRRSVDLSLGNLERLTVVRPIEHRRLRGVRRELRLLNVGALLHGPRRGP